MSAVFRREFKAFFTSPIGYFVLAVLFAFSGFFFTVYNLIMLVLPILTMRLFSDEKRQRTDQALLTAPVSLTSIVLGKFFAALLIFALGSCIMLVYAVIISFQVSPDWVVILGNYVGMLLLGAMIISIGLFLSSLTESQLIAALGTFAVSFCLIMLDSLSSLFYGNEIINSVVSFLSVTQRYNDFTSGIISYDNIIFFLSIQILFIFLTVRVLDRKRWS